MGLKWFGHMKRMDISRLASALSVKKPATAEEKMNRQYYVSDLHRRENVTESSACERRNAWIEKKKTEERPTSLSR